MPTPRELQSGDQPSSETRTPLAGLADSPKASLPGPGQSALADALRGSFSGSPPNFGTPPQRPLSPVSQVSQGLGAPRTNYGSFGSGQPGSAAMAGSPGGRLEDHEVVRRHLVGPGGNNSSSNLAGTNYGSPKRSSNNGVWQSTARDEEEEISSLQLQGGDITRQIYRWTEQQEAAAKGSYRRSRSFAAPRPDPNDPASDIGSIKQPGGFRRNYIRRTAASPSPGPSTGGRGGPAAAARQPKVFTNNFLEFLSLYGHFAGEELEEDDEALGPDEYFSSEFEGESAAESSDDEGRHPGEHSALLTPKKRRKHRRERTEGKGSPSGAAMLLLKSFVGTGVLGALTSDWRLVVAMQDYTAMSPVPDVKLPAFALVVDVRPDDEDMFRAFFAQVDPEYVRLRFFAPVRDFSHAFLARLTQLDYSRAIAFVEGYSTTSLVRRIRG